MNRIHSIANRSALSRAFYVLSKAALLPVLVFILATQTTHAAIDATRVASGFDMPLYLCSPPGDTGRLFVVEQTGKIKIIKIPSTTVNAIPYLDVSGEITTSGTNRDCSA
jgi:hypothetical protein